MDESIIPSPIRRTVAALGGRLRPVAVLAITGAALLVGVAAVAPVPGADALATAAKQTERDGQAFAMQSLSAAVTVAARDELGAQISPARYIAELTATRDQAAWARLVLYYGDWEITDEKVAAITQWMRAENYPESWWLRNNPLNNGWYTSTGTYLGSYASLDRAAFYAADAIRSRGLYPGIAAALGDSGSSTTTVASAIIESGWATGFYGGGSHWHTGDVPAYQAPASAWGS